MPPDADAKTDPAPRFVTGSTMRHVVVMAASGAVGLMSLFIVDLVNLLYISLLGDPALTAAVGFATTIIFFFVSLCVGLMIGGTALTARALGARNRDGARRVAASSLALIVVVTTVLSLAVLPFARPLLRLLGATGETLEVAHLYLVIVLPATALLGAFMGLGGTLRAVGDAKRAMYLTLVFGLTTAILDPIFIFALDLGVTGAATVAVISRIVTVVFGLYAVIRVHGMLARPSLAAVRTDLRPLAGIALPAVMTNIATPVGNGYVTAAIAQFGDSAVAGWTIVSRLLPVAFAALFALSGAIGPILAQNFGARRFDRVRGALTDAVIFSAVYLVAISLVLFLARDGLVAVFQVDGEAADLVIFFCSGIATVYGFMAGLFVSNAAFNNLGYPLLSTAFNWGRATLGTVPFVLAGAALADARGVIAGFAIGSIPFGIAAILICYRVIRRLDAHDRRAAGPTGEIGAGATTPAVPHERS